MKYFSKHLSQVGNKADTFISDAFKPYLKQYNEKKIRTYMVLFDSASDFQKLGQILAASYPRITVLHGAEHVLSLCFSDIANFQLSG